MTLEDWQGSWCKPDFADEEQTDGKRDVSRCVLNSGVLNPQAQSSPWVVESWPAFHVNVIAHILFRQSGHWALVRLI